MDYKGDQGGGRSPRTLKRQVQFNHGERQRPPPLTGRGCPGWVGTARSHTCRPPRLTARPFSLSSPQALAAPPAPFLSEPHAGCHARSRHHNASASLTGERLSLTTTVLHHAASHHPPHADSYTPTAASASLSLTHTHSLSRVSHSLPPSLFPPPPQPAAPFPSHRCPLP